MVNIYPITKMDNWRGKGTYKDDEKHGEWEFYHSNGELKSKTKLQRWDDRRW